MSLAPKAYPHDTATAQGGERAILPLDGPWDFRMEGQDAWRTATVPAPWQALFDDLRHASGTALYRRRIAIPAEWRGREVALCFGAVSHRAEVSLDGRPVGAHDGGYLPFEIPLGSDLQGEHSIEVRVTLPSGDADLYPEAPFPEVPHGKQSWYGPLGGIWQSVRLEARSARHVWGAAIAADLATGAVRIRADLAGEGGGTLSAVVFGPDGGVAAAGDAAVSGPTAEIALKVEAPAAWSPDAPNLYRLELRLGGEGGTADLWRDSFGFRTIEARDGRIYLNGAPLYLRGALDQDYYPDGLCTPPSLEFLEDQLLKAKAMGLNCLRVHIKVPDPRYYEVADRLGMLIWTELPNLEYFTPQAAARLRETLEGIVARDRNHPSIVAWTIINEDWGTQLPEDEEHRRWLLDTYAWMKRLDPTRLVVDNSPCTPNFHLKSDVNDYHYYRCLPERRAEWDRLTEEFAAASAWTYSQHGDAEQTGREPLIVSEFGVWGLPHPDLLRNADGSEPWWMETGQSWGDGTAYPHGLRERFVVRRLDLVFGSFERFVEATQWHQFKSLKYQIESMRWHDTISGYVVTELTDVHWEANGLMDMRRNPRVFHEAFAAVNRDLVVLARVERWAYWSGEAIGIELAVATGMAALPEGATLEWSAGGAGGTVAVPPTGPMAAPRLGRIDLAAPALEAPGRLRIDFVLRDGGGAELARNALDVSVYPRLAGDPALRVHSPHPEILARLAALGYAAAARAEEADVVVVRSVDAADVEAIRLGA
ncbi:MAG TPA: glycoside hydrolase family 2 TIM barrel-domain containing protein, partial [Alphaproteobacteria bacterium]|nr:glycoside hydrolase family 2 TIM barrel-domain containing protein [Alphaproteobacteria bacterium]